MKANGIFGVVVLLGLWLAPEFGSSQTVLGTNLAVLTDGGTVFAMARQPDGKIIIGGNFQYVNQLARRNIARLNTDGSVDATWNPNANSWIYALAVDGTNIYAGGIFTTIGGLARNRIARLNDTDGSADPNWNPSANNTVSALVADGTNVYAGGTFTNIGGQARNRIARLNDTDGLADPTWNPNAYGLVDDLAVDGTNIYAGGTFTNIGGQARNRIARLNDTTGLADTTWNPNAGALSGNRVYTLAVDGTNIYAGGTFTNIGGQARNNIARLNDTDGSADPNWNPNAGTNANDSVRALVVIGTNIYAGGTFTNIGGQARNRIARLNDPNGTADPNWNSDANDSVWALAADGTNIYAGGVFTTIGGVNRCAIAKLNPTNGVVDIQFPAETGSPGNINAIARQADGKIIMGGYFKRAGGLVRNNIARLNAAGGIDTNWNPNANNVIYTFAVAGTNIYAGGTFTNIGGQARNYIARLNDTDGLADPTWNPNADGSVDALAVAGTNVYVGGDFTTIGGQARNRIARLNDTDGSADVTWNPNANNWIYALAVAGTNVYVGGDFTTIGGQARNRIARLNDTDGSADATWNPNADDSVGTLAVAGTNIYAGGTFTTIGGLARNNIARLNDTDGSADPNWNPNADLYVMALTVDGTNIYAAGYFTTIGGQARNYIARLNDTDGSADATWNPNADSDVDALAAAGTNLYMGGAFTQVGGLDRVAFAIVSIPGAPLPPSAPTGLTASDGTYTDKVALVWNSVAEADGYIVYRSESAATNSASPIGTSVTTNYDDTTAIPAQVYYFWVVATNTAGVSGLSQSNTGYRASATAPSITGNPQSLTNNPGSSASFTVTATGTLPLYYQWQKDSANISGATATNYTIASVAETNEGNYRCVVTNIAGSATSSVASLTVNDPPAITTQPVSLTINPGSSANFTVIASGTVPLNYQWQKNSANISGATSTNYMIASVAETNEGNYRCIVTNMAGSVTSSVASLTMNDPPTAPAGLIASDGDYTNKVALSWSAVSGATGYQIFRYTVNNSASAVQIGTVTSSTYDDTGAVAGTIYYYWVKATNAAGASGFSASDSGWRRAVYTITATAGANGSITPSGAVPVLQGASQGFTILPSAGYYISSVQVDGVTIAAASTYRYTFENVSANHSLAAAFVANQPPQLVLTATPQSGVAPLRVLFNFTGSTDPDGVIAKYEVDRNGDGIFEVQSTESGVFYVEFAAAGNYQAVARVTDDCNATSTTSVTIQVHGMSPVAVIEAQPLSGTAPLTVNFTGTNSTAPGGRHLVAYEWDFDGDGVYDRLTRDGLASWTYREAGTNLATLRVTDVAGMKAESSTLVVVAPSPFPPPTVTLSANPEAGYLPLTVAFAAQLAQGQVSTNYYWDFDGDGQYDTRTTTGVCSNTYTVAGMYAARVLAMDTNGLTGLGVVTVRVNQATTLRAWIITPKDNSCVSGTKVSLRANAVPGNLVASAQFQYKPAASNDWINIGGAIYPPHAYALTWDVTGVPPTNYHVRVAVTDTAGEIVYSDVIHVTVARSSHLATSSQRQPGDIEEGIEDGKHYKTETFSQDSSATLIVYDGTTVLVRMGTVDSNITINVILTGLNTNPVNGSAFGRTCIHANRQVSIEGNPELQKAVVIIIPYLDNDNDGIVDGTRVKVSTLMMFWYDPETATWKRCLETEVYPDEKYVKGTTYQLAEFGLFGGVREAPIYGDFDGDRKSDPAIYQMATGIWRVLLSGSGYQETQITLGGPDFRAVPADYDADQKTDPGVYRDKSGYWYGYLSGSAYAPGEASVGGLGYLFVPSDYDGDGKADPAVYQETTGIWSALLSGSGYQAATAAFGGTGYAAIPGDYDGDGKTDPAVYQEGSGLWNVMLSGSGYAPAAIGYGGPGWSPAAADYDGDGRTDPAIYNASSGQWAILMSNSGYEQTSFIIGGPGYYPVPGDYDGAGRISPAVYLEITGEWQALLSGSEYAPATATFGGQDFMPANVCR